MAIDTTKGTDALVTELADEIIKHLKDSYDLVFVQYDDQLMDSQVNKLVRGDDDWLEESYPFEGEAKYEGSKEIISELVDEIVGEWSEEADADLRFVRDEFYARDDYDEVRFEIEARDDGSWVQKLVNQTPDVLLRINVLDEDHCYSHEEVKPRKVLKDLGVRATKANVEAVDYVLVNASPEFSVLLGYWIVGASVSDLYELPYDTTEVEIVNPYLYLGNPFSGSGFISEQPLEGTVRVKREDLRTDEDAFGYAVNEIYGRLNPSQFSAEIRPIPNPERESEEDR